MLAPRNLQF